MLQEKYFGGKQAEEEKEEEKRKKDEEEKSERAEQWYKKNKQKMNEFKEFRFSPLKVMTYNVFGCYNIRNKAELKQLINIFNEADVIGIQEGMFLIECLQVYDTLNESALGFFDQWEYAVGDVDGNKNRTFWTDQFQYIPGYLKEALDDFETPHNLNKFFMVPPDREVKFTPVFKTADKAVGEAEYFLTTENSKQYSFVGGNRTNKDVIVLEKISKEYKTTTNTKIKTITEQMMQVLKQPETPQTVLQMKDACKLLRGNQPLHLTWGKNEYVIETLVSKTKEDEHFESYKENAETTIKKIDDKIETQMTHKNTEQKKLKDLLIPGEDSSMPRTGDRTILMWKKGITKTGSPDAKKQTKNCKTNRMKLRCTLEVPGFRTLVCDVEHGCGGVIDEGYLEGLPQNREEKAETFISTFADVLIGENATDIGFFDANVCGSVYLTGEQNHPYYTNYELYINGRFPPQPPPEDSSSTGAAPSEAVSPQPSFFEILQTQFRTKIGRVQNGVLHTTGGNHYELAITDFETTANPTTQPDQIFANKSKCKKVSSVVQPYKTYEKGTNVSDHAYVLMALMPSN